MHTVVRVTDDDARLLDGETRGEDVVLVVGTFLSTAVALLVLGVLLPTQYRRPCALALLLLALLVWTPVAVRGIARRLAVRAPGAAVLLFSLRLPAALGLASAAGAALHGRLYTRNDAVSFFQLMLLAAGLFGADTVAMHGLQDAFRKRTYARRLRAVEGARTVIDALLKHADASPLRTACRTDARILSLLSCDVALPWLLRMPEILLTQAFRILRIRLPPPDVPFPETENARAAADAIFASLRPHGETLGAADVAPVFGSGSAAALGTLLSLDDDSSDSPLVDLEPGAGLTSSADDSVSRAKASPADAKEQIEKPPALTRNGLTAVVAHVLEEHNAVEQSARHTSGVFAALHVGLHVAVAVALLSTAAPVLSDAISASSVLAAAVPIFLAAHAMVGDAVQKMARSLLFVLLVHPFDVGDLVVLGADVRGASDEDVLRVRAIGLSRTVFVRWNGMELVVPNAVLGDARAGITNVSRARTQWERLEFDVSLRGGVRGAQLEAALSALRSAAEAFLRSHPRDYCTDAPGDWDLRAAIAADNGHSDAVVAAGSSSDPAHGSTIRLRAVLRVRCHWSRSAHRRWVRHARLLAFVAQDLAPSAL